MSVSIQLDHEIRLNGYEIPADMSGQIIMDLTIFDEEEDEIIDLWEVEGDKLVVPRGYAFKLADLAKEYGVEFDWDDRRVKSKGFVRGKPLPLEPEQLRVVEWMLEVEQGIAKAPPGAGKTVMCLEIVRRIPGNSIVIVNTKEIAGQWVQQVKKYLGEDSPVGIVGDGKFEVAKGGLTVAIQGTLHSRRDQLLDEGFFDYFTVCMLDECFPAGTMVGDKAIETLKSGDVVPSYDEDREEFVDKKVANVMKSKPVEMVRVHLSNGESIDCTSGHPFLTTSGWKPAKLISGCMVRYDDRHEIPVEKEAGSQEGIVPDWIGVDYIEILQPGSDRRFGGVCPDGFVYNIEVEDTHTYVVNGVVVHNCHHATARTFNEVFAFFSAKYRIGVSATPEKTGVFELAEAVIGPVVVEVEEEDVSRIEKPTIEVIESKLSFGAERRGLKFKKQKKMTYEQMLKGLLADEDRLMLVVNEIMTNWTGSRNLVISKRIEHLENVHSELELAGYPGELLVMVGAHSLKERQAAIAMIDEGPCVLLTTLADEALDAPLLEVLHLIWPTSNVELVTQQIGRVRRKHKDKKQSLVIDYYDPMVPPFRKQYMGRRHDLYNPRGFPVIKRKKEKPHEIHG